MKSLVRKKDNDNVNRTAATGNSNSSSSSSSSGRSASTTLTALTSTAMLFALLVLYTVVAPSSSLSVQQFHRRHPTKLSSPRITAVRSASQLSMALGSGGNYLDNMNNNENNDNTDGTSNSGGSDYRDGINSRSNSNNNNNRGSGGGWGNFFNRKGTNSNNNNGGGGPSGRASQDVGRGNTAAGVGTAIRPSMETQTTNGGNNGGGPPNGGYTQKWRPNGGNNNNNGNNGVSKVFDIRQPQDLLDFVISDERLSVVKVYASWCKTCQVFDIRYRKLASQLGDKYGDAAGNELLSRGNVRFAQMKFDDPNNEEMCKLLNATKLPYILIYKGSQGKVADFQCGPAKFQMLIDAVNEFADPMEEMMSSSVGEEEMEWRVAQEQEEQQRQMQQQQQQQQQQRERSSPLPQQEQPRPAYGDIQYQSSMGARSSSSSSSDNATALKRKDEEINRLLTEMSNLRNKFDRSIAAMKDERQKETGYLQQQIDEQRKQYEKERMALSAQIDDLTREMMDREKEYRTGEDATSYQLRQEMAKKEKEYQETLTGLNLQITEMERTLFKSKNELQYNSDTSASDRKRLVDQINVLEEEILSLTSKNEELEKELIEEKRLVVASTEEANRVLLQLNKIRNNEDEERKELVARVKELEAQISNRENEIVQGTGNLARDLRREMDGLKEEHEQERELMAARIIELEQELSYREETWQSDNQSFEEGERLAQRIVELEKSIDERDRLLKTSNKATDILLDNMEAQKQGYEEELERTTSLVNELEEAIAGREQEMQMLQERLSALERLDGNGRPQEQGQQNQGKGPGAFSFADAVQMSEGFARAAENGGNFGGAAGGALAGEREARLAAEKEVNKLMGFLKDREEEINRMRSGGSEDYGQNGAYAQQNGDYGQNYGADGSQEQKSFFDKMFGTRQPKDPNAQTNDGMNNMNDGMMANEYDMLNDVLLPDEVSPPRGRRGGGQEDVYVGAGSPFGGGGGSRGGGGGEGVYSNSMTPSPAVASPPAGLPTPAQAFERRLAENPIVPSGAFGGSKPTASFFQSSSSGGGWDDSTISAYAAQSSGSQDMAPSPSYNGEEPALPPAKSFEPRPATPSPRQPIKQAVSDNIYAGAGTATRGGTASGRGRVDNVRPDNTRPSDNIYSGAGTASGGGGSASSSREYSSGRGRVDNVRPDNTRARAGEMTPSPSVVSEPSAPLPTPAQAFERRLAENPIVPAGAFGGSRPTSHFFSQTQPSPPAASASSEEEVSPQDEAQAKWRSMDDAEKKRIASEAYKTFEKQITDSRNTPNSKGGVPPSRTNPPNLLSSLSRGEPVESQSKPVASQGKPVTSQGKPVANQGTAASQREIERKKHQDMVKAAETSPDKAKFGAPVSAAVDAKKPENGAKPGQTANDIQKSAAAASAKRMSLAERAAQAELDRKAEERRIKAEQRRARESGGRADGTQVNVKNEAARPEPTTNVKRKVASENVSSQNKKSNIEQKEMAAQETNKIESKAEPSVKSKTAGSDRTEKKPKGFGKNQVEKKASPVGETSKAATQQNTAKGEASEKQGKQAATVSAKGGVKKKAPSKNGLKAPKYDVIVKSPSEMDMQPLDMPQLLQGSLTDLLKKGPKRGSGERPRGRSDY